jgi:hypothetical protein
MGQIMYFTAKNLVFQERRGADFEIMLAKIQKGRRRDRREVLVRVPEK